VGRARLGWQFLCLTFEARKKKKVEAKIYSIGNWPVERAVVHAGCRGLEADMAEC